MSEINLIIQKGFIALLGIIANLSVVSPVSQITPSNLATEIQPVKQNQDIEYDFSYIENQLDESVLKIICHEKKENDLIQYSGSGVLIDPNGVVITNAHVASHFLFPKEQVDCFLINNLSPDKKMVASILYFPEDWALENVGILDQINPSGTGLNDYALLLLEKDDLNQSKFFPFFEIGFNLEPKEGDIFVIAGYPNILEEFNSSLLKKDQIEVAEIYTFDEKTGESPDLILTSPTFLAQKGISGGGIFRYDKFLGLIVALHQVQEEKSVGVMTSDYIYRDFLIDNQKTIYEFLSSNNLEEKVKEFENKNKKRILEILLGQR